MCRQTWPGRIARSFALRTVLAGVLAAYVAGCASTRELEPSRARIVNPVDAVIIPPPGGPALLKLVSTTYPHAVKQDIFLATQAGTAGENRLSVVMFEGRGGDADDAGPRDIPFTQVNLTEEALAAFPGSGMSVSPYFVQNAYGPFGYAIAKPGNGDTCIYAWQRIEPALKPSGAIDRGAITIRLQLCQRGANEQQLVEVMYRLRLNVSVFPPGRAPARIGLINNPIRPVGAEGFAEVIPSATPAPAPQSRPAVVRATPPAAPVRAVPVPPPGSPIVPPPSGGGNAGPAVPSPGGGGASGGPAVPRPPASGASVPSPSLSN